MITLEKTLEAKQAIAAQASQLPKMKVRELLSLLRAAGVTAVTRNGKEIKVGSARKSELLATAQLIATEAIAVQETDVHLGLKGFNREFGDTENSRKFATIGRTVAEELCKLAFKAELGQLKQAYQGINTLAANAHASFRRLFSANSKDSSTLYRYRTLFYNATADALSHIGATKPDMLPDNWLEWYGNFKTAFNGLTSNYTTARAKAMDTAARAKNVDNDAIKVNIEPALTKALETLQNLEDLPSGRWPDVTTALLLATGRRPSELHTIAEFQVTGEYELLFNGQLKTRDTHDVADLPIPTLLPATLCVRGLQWLINNGKRIQPGETVKGREVRDASDAATKADRRYSSPLSQNFRDNWRDLFQADHGSSEAKPLKMYDCRGFYVKRCQQLHTGSMTPAQREAYASKILGHTLRSDGTDPVVRAYDSGFIIVD